MKCINEQRSTSDPMTQQDPRATASLRLLTIMDELREQCPWDRKQTMETLRPLTGFEETYELGDAILNNDLQEVKNELGDLIFHMVFYAKIGSEQKAFDITDVLNGICEKLINRHPHIYSDVKVKDEEEVKANWEKIKLAEKAKSTKNGDVPSVLEGVPRGLPSMVKAIGSRIRHVALASIGTTVSRFGKRYTRSWVS